MHASKIAAIVSSQLQVLFVFVRKCKVPVKEIKQVPAPNHIAKGTLILARKGVTAKFTDEPTRFRVISKIEPASHYDKKPTNTGEREYEAEGKSQLRTIEPTGSEVVLRHSEGFATKAKYETAREAHPVLLELNSKCKYQFACKDETTE